jgi:hypothetical protein
MQLSRQVCTWYVGVQAIVLMIAFLALLINSLFGKSLRFVTLISFAFIISNIALAIGTILFNTQNQEVLSQHFDQVLAISLPFNVVMCMFVITLCVPHWVFFYTYFECCTTMPYFYRQEKVPRWLTNCLNGLNATMITAQVVVPVMVFYYAQMANEFYYGAFTQPNFNPLTFDFSKGDKLSGWEKFWLNCLVYTQCANALILFVSILQIRHIINKYGYNKLVNSKSFIIHGVLFVGYTGSVIFFMIWNQASVDALN